MTEKEKHFNSLKTINRNLHHKFTSINITLIIVFLFFNSLPCLKRGQQEGKKEWVKAKKVGGSWNEKINCKNEVGIEWIRSHLLFFTKIWRLNFCKNRYISVSFPLFVGEYNIDVLYEYCFALWQKDFI